MNDPALTRALGDLVALDRMLVGVDFDGTLAPLVDDPMDAAALPGATEVLGRLAALPGVTVAVVSGRALATLHALAGLPQTVVLIGSHGVESSRTGEVRLSDRDARQLAALDDDLKVVLAEHPGVRLERKPTSLVLHTRGMPSRRARAALAAGEEAARRHGEVLLTPGKDVLELAVTEAGKGAAVLALAEAEGADGLLYIGDDVTDERAFEVLGGRAVTVRVGGSEPTAATYRVPDEQAVLDLLRELVRLRGEVSVG